MFKFISEIGPLAAFFIGYRIGGIQTATLYTLIVSILSLIASYLINGKVQIFALVSTGVLLVSASITLISGNAMFIKIKPTILYIIFGTAFLFSAIKGRPFIKYLFEKTIALRDAAWLHLSYRAAIFFYVMAVLNEYVWRNYSEGAWVNFKVYGALPLTLVFILLQLPFVLNNKLPE